MLFSLLLVVESFTMSECRVTLAALPISSYGGLCGQQIGDEALFNVYLLVG
jgi:hypothetical protein